jgi:uncharacterized protein
MFLNILYFVIDGVLLMPVFLDANDIGYVRMGAFSWGALYIAILIVMAVIFSANVAFRRNPLKIGIGDGGNAHLARQMRVHGNFLENVPLAIGALIMLCAIGAPAWAVHIVGVSMIIGRILHAVGISQNSGASFGRAVGMILTYASLLCAAGFLIRFSWFSVI